MGDEREGGVITLLYFGLEWKPGFPAGILKVPTLSMCHAVTSWQLVPCISAYQLRHDAHFAITSRLHK